MRVDVAGDVTGSRHEARIVSSLRRYPLSKARLIWQEPNLIPRGNRHLASVHRPPHRSIKRPHQERHLPTRRRNAASFPA